MFAHTIKNGNGEQVLISGYTGKGDYRFKELKLINDNSNTVELESATGTIYLYNRPGKSLSSIMGRTYLSDATINILK
jgi:hypothetical protein